MDWFLYDNDLRHERVMSKKFSNLCFSKDQEEENLAGIYFRKAFIEALI